MRGRYLIEDSIEMMPLAMRYEVFCYKISNAFYQFKKLYASIIKIHLILEFILTNMISRLGKKRYEQVHKINS